MNSYDQGTLISHLVRLRFLHGSLRRRVRARVYASRDVWAIYYYAMYAKERLPVELEVLIMSCRSGEAMGTRYAKEVLGLGGVSWWRYYCLWKNKAPHEEFGQHLEDILRRTDEKYSYLYPDSKVH